MHGMNYLHIESLCKSFSNPSVPSQGLVLNSISFDVSEGSFTSIFGPNGSGKTTILNIISGISKADSGIIRIKETSAAKTNISYVFQDYSSSLMPWLTCLDNIALPLKLHSMKNRSERRRFVENFVEQDLQLSGIPFYRYPYQCSGGQKQMTALARALITQPELLLIDEGFGSLDYSTRLSLEKKLLEIWQKLKNTILLVSHEIDEAIFISDKIIILSKAPSSVIDIVQVDLPRPRIYEEIIGTSKFQQLRSKVISLFLNGQK